MASLGSFGAAAREYDPAAADKDDFEFYGEKFVVHQQIPAMVELTMTAALAGKATAMDGDGAMYEALQIALTVPEYEADGEKVRADTSQWERFNRLATSEGAPSEVLVALALNIAAAQLGRPTERRSGSSPGPSRTSTNSSSSSSATPDSPDSPPDAADSAG